MSSPLQRILHTARLMTTAAPATPEAALAQLSTCEVADALVKLQVPAGGHLPGIDRYSPEPLPAPAPEAVCGRAYTVRMVAGTQASAPKPPVHFADAIPAGSVIVIQAPSNARSAAWGGLMTLRAQALGAKAVVIDGRCRDLGEHRTAGFQVRIPLPCPAPPAQARAPCSVLLHEACCMPASPLSHTRPAQVFARGHSVLGQAPFTRPSELNVPLTIADPTLNPAPAPAAGEAAADPCFPPATVHPGDYVLADVDGVVVVPPSLVDQVLALARKGREVDARVAADLKQGVSVAEAFKRHRGK